MGISDLYMSIGLKRNISHFANMVKVAKSDKIITPHELELLKKIAKAYNISDKKFKKIIKSPEKTPTLAYLDCEERIERFYDLLKMVSVDHKPQTKEISVLRRIAAGLAFPIQNVDKIVDTAIQIDIINCDMDTFKKKILKANQF